MTLKDSLNLEQDPCVARDLWHIVFVKYESAQHIYNKQIISTESASLVW
jgi:hypothetical protein